MGRSTDDPRVVRRIKGKNICYADHVPPRSCLVTLTDSRGIRHSVEVTAESLFEAGGLR